MKTMVDPKTQPDTLFDAIAILLPTTQREYFYRRMAHLRQLQPDDEMLQIAEAMGFLALLIREAPAAMAVERGQFDELLRKHTATLATIDQNTTKYHQHLEQRLAQLPQAITTGIHPQKIAAMIEGLRQQFVETGMPYTAEVLNVSFARMREVSAELSKALN